MSMNNVLPGWIIDLENILGPIEKCLPEERAKAYPEAMKQLLDNRTIPQHVRETWIKRIKYGYTWEKGNRAYEIPPRS